METGGIKVLSKNPGVEVDEYPRLQYALLNLNRPIYDIALGAVVAISKIRVSMADRLYLQ